MSKKKIIIALLSIIGVYFYFSGDSNKTPDYLTETVIRGSIQKTVIATGTIRSSNRVQVGAQVSGQIKKLAVKLGQKVKKGELIAEIDSITQTNNLNTAIAQLNSNQVQLKTSQTNYEIAQSNYERSAKAYRNKVISLDALNTAKSNLASAEANLEEAKTATKRSEIEVNTARTNLSYTVINSPIDGTVISIPISEGQTVNANQVTPTIVQVADLTKMLIKPEISEGDITKVHTGMKVIFTTLSEPDRKYQSTIFSVDPATSTLTDNNYSESVANSDAVYYYANVLIDNEDNKLHVGMTTQNTIIISEVENVLLVPTLTLKKEQDYFYVNVLGDDNKVEKKKVAIGINDDINTQIISGLKEGEKVISSALEDGEQVGESFRGPRIL